MGEQQRLFQALSLLKKKNQKIQDRGWTAVWYHRVSIQPWEIQAASVPELVVNLACIYLAHFLFTVPPERTNPQAVTTRTPLNLVALLKQCLRFEGKHRYLPVKTTGVVNSVIFRGQTRQSQQVFGNTSTCVYFVHVCIFTFTFGHPWAVSLMESCPSLPVLGLHAMPAQGLPEAQRHPQEGKMPTAAQFISLPSSALLAPLAISTPYFPHTSHSHELLFLPKSLSHQEGQGKVLCQIVTQEKSECAHVSYIIFTLSLPFFSINSNHPPTAVHLGFSHDSWQI